MPCVLYGICLKGGHFGEVCIDYISVTSSPKSPQQIAVTWHMHRDVKPEIMLWNIIYGCCLYICHVTATFHVFYTVGMSFCICIRSLALASINIRMKWLTLILILGQIWSYRTPFLKELIMATQLLKHIIPEDLNTRVKRQKEKTVISFPPRGRLYYHKPN